MAQQTTSAYEGTTQEHLNIQDINYNTVFMKDGSAAMVIQISAVNFSLLSEEEQDAIIYAYVSLLNSLTFPVQILIRSQRKDITKYLNNIEAQEAQTTDKIIRDRMKSYRKFIQSVIQERNVLDKKFYAIVPFSRLDLGLTDSGIIPGLNNKTDHNLDFPFVVQKTLSTLEPRRDHMLRQFSRIGLQAKQLDNSQLIHLLYTIYNPDSAEGVKTMEAKQYADALVRVRR